jgi:hypothetical protein
LTAVGAVLKTYLSDLDSLVTVPAGLVGSWPVFVRETRCQALLLLPRIEARAEAVRERRCISVMGG